MHGICKSELPAAKLVSVYKGVAVIVNRMRQSNKNMNERYGRQSCEAR